MQVPRSSKLIYEDNDYSLYSVTLFKRVADSFKQAARSKGFQVSTWQHPWPCALQHICKTPTLHRYLVGHTGHPSARVWFCQNSCCVPTLQVRDYEFDQEMQSNQSEAAKALKANADKKRAQLEEWSASAYGEVSCCHPYGYLDHMSSSRSGMSLSRISQKTRQQNG